MSIWPIFLQHFDQVNNFLKELKFLNFYFSIICKNCNPGFYTVSEIIPCKKCPSGGICNNGILRAQKSSFLINSNTHYFFQFYFSQDFWRNDIFSGKIYECQPNPYSCK